MNDKNITERDLVDKASDKDMLDFSCTDRKTDGIELQTMFSKNNLTVDGKSKAFSVEDIEVQNHGNAISGQPLSYDEKRKQLRYGKFATLILIFKSTVGICYFNYHFAIMKAGIVLSAFLN